MSSPAPVDIKARLKDSYDTIADVYNDWTKQQFSYRLTYLEKLLALPPFNQTPDEVPAANILELGCGAGIPGTAALLAHGSGVHVIANDISSVQIARGKEKLGSERVTWLEGDMMKLEFQDATFDAVVGFYSLIHLPRDEQVVMLGRIVRWLKPGGYLLANFSSREMESTVNDNWLADKGWMFWSGWGTEGTLEKAKEAGLEVLEADVVQDNVDGSFLWLIARVPAS